MHATLGIGWLGGSVTLTILLYHMIADRFKGLDVLGRGFWLVAPVAAITVALSAVTGIGILLGA